MSGGQGSGHFVSMAEYAHRVELEAERFACAIRQGVLTMQELHDSGMNQDVIAAVSKKLAPDLGSNER